MTMTAAPLPGFTGPADSPLSSDVLAHLEAQLCSARTLLGIVLAQGKAIRARDVHTVVLQAGHLQAELHRRRQIETDRARLLARAGTQLQIASSAVTLEALTQLMAPAAAQIARDSSAELRGLLDEAQREHTVNRALMSQEMAFLDHLLQLVDVRGSGAYGSAAARPSSQANSSVGARRILDMTA